MATLNFKVQNNSGISSDQIFIGFWGSDLNATINGAPMKSIKDSTWYTLSEIKSFVIEATTSGRIYVAYYQPFDPTSAGGIPSVVAPNSPAYTQRFDKFELTFDGSAYGVADLTAIDYWSVPMSLATEKDGVSVGSLDGVRAGSTENEIYTSLSKLSSPPQSLPTGQAIIAAFNGAGYPLASGIQDQLTNPASGLVTDASGNFVRIIGPNTYPPFGEPAQNLPPGLPFTPYNTFLDYFQYLIDTFGPGQATPPGFSQLGDGKIAQLAGEFTGSNAGSGHPFERQTYNLWASIDDDFNLAIDGTGSLVGDIKLTVSKWDLLNPAATYGGNPTFSLNGGAPQTPLNDIYAHIFGDFFAGLNIGAIGSAVTVDGTVVGEMTSSEWFSKLPQAGYLFDKLWSSQVTNYWNQWAQQLNPRSDAYNFAYAERFSAPQLSINPDTVDTLTLTLLNADVTS
ncbi:MAG TPA: beta-1,3-glucanase family protein [Herpetosiphonaceae bacterium]